MYLCSENFQIPMLDVHELTAKRDQFFDSIIKSTQKPKDPNIGVIEKLSTREVRFRYIRECLTQDFIYNPPILNGLRNDPRLKRYLKTHVIHYPIESKHLGLDFFYHHIFGGYILESIELAQILSKKYNVEVQVVTSDDEYYSDSTITRSITDNVYFISEQNPIKTKDQTEFLIRYNQIRQPLVTPINNVELLKSAHLKLQEKVDDKARELGSQIDTIRSWHRRNHNGSEPPLLKIAEILNERGVNTPSGKSQKWTATTVKRTINRFNSLTDPDGSRSK